MSALYSIQPAERACSARLNKLPILVLNIHTQCNCRCVMCDIWKRKDGRSLHPDALLPHRESILSLGVEQVVLTGGEPLLNREFETIARFFKDLQLRITLLTSGLLLKKHAGTVAAFIDEVILSLDGPQHIHDQVRRVPDGFQRIRLGIESLRSHRLAMPISCRTTVQKSNHAHLCATVDAARSLELDSISFLPADLSSTAFNREDGWSDERQETIALTRRETERLEEEIENLIAVHGSDIDQHFIVESRSKLRRIATRFRERIDGTAPTAPQCNAPWHSAVIEVDGDVRPCFFHPPTANISHGTLSEALQSPSAAAFRDTLDVATNSVCQRCVCSLNYREGTSSLEGSYRKKVY